MKIKLLIFSISPSLFGSSEREKFSQHYPILNTIKPIWSSVYGAALKMPCEVSREVSHADISVKDECAYSGAFLEMAIGYDEWGRNGPPDFNHLNVMGCRYIQGEDFSHSQRASVQNLSIIVV